MLATMLAAILPAFPSDCRHNPATVQFSSLRRELRADMIEMKSDLKGDMAEMKSALNTRTTSREAVQITQAGLLGHIDEKLSLHIADGHNHVAVR